MRPIFHTIMAGLCLVVIAGCGVTKPSKYYLLTPVDLDSAGSLDTQAGIIGIGPLAFPTYLDRPQIAVRSGGNQIDYADSHRWAEPLKTAFIQTLSENLSRMLSVERSVIYPWSRSTSLDYQVMVNVTRFDADAAGNVTLTTDWEIMRTIDSYSVDQNKATYTEAAGSIDYPAIVAAQSRAVEQLSRDIAAAINKAVAITDQPS